MANIRDIAKLTGYSVSTISRVINNNPYVDEQKRQEIFAGNGTSQLYPESYGTCAKLGKNEEHRSDSPICQSSVF